MARRVNDFYPTPAWATSELLKHVSVEGCYVLECCNGDGAISRALNGAVVKTNDIDRRQKADYYLDVSVVESWRQFPRGGHWVVTNPPYNLAPLILPLAYDYAEFGIAMLLRLSFLEPVENRGAWLNQHPPTTLVVLPRISFTGDGKTDNVTCAWMVWEKKSITQRVVVAKNPRFTQRTTAASGGGG